MSTSVNLSKRIKITISNDPVFSGIYVFDRGFGDSFLNSNFWIFNTGLSQYNLNAYNHPESFLNGKLLVSLSDTNYPEYLPGYNELKTSLYKGENNSLANQLEDVFSFPAKFVFTAVQPPCPCSGEIGTAWPPISTIQASGHRLAVGFVPPIRWRHPYDNWIVVDKISHIISGIPNYATGALFNNGITYFSTTDQADVVLNNSKSIRYTESYLPGTASSEIGNGYLGITTADTGFWPVCTGLPDLGFSFRVSASGLGIAKDRRSEHFGLWDEPAHIQGIGPLQVYETYYTWNDADSATTTLVDERPFFGPKIPVVAEIEFAYSCRNGLPCFDLTSVPITDTSILPVNDININNCDYDSNPNIYLNYLCGTSQTSVPSDSTWINNSITGIKVVFSGLSGTIPGVTTDIIQSNRYYDIYVSNVERPIIEIPYGGPTNVNGAVPSLVSNWISNYLILIDNPNNIILNQSNFNTNLANGAIKFFPSVDLYWNIDYPNNSATVYLVPNESEFGNNFYILVQGAGTAEINGKYMFEGGYYKNVTSLTSWKIRLTSMGYIIGTGDNPGEWVSYYLLSDTEPLLVLNSTVNWSIPGGFAGSSPPPISIMLID
jgi:hypothetical protein